VITEMNQKFFELRVLLFAKTSDEIESGIKTYPDDWIDYISDFCGNQFDEMLGGLDLNTSQGRAEAIAQIVDAFARVGSNQNFLGYNCTSGYRYYSNGAKMNRMGHPDRVAADSIEGFNFVVRNLFLDIFRYPQDVVSNFYDKRNARVVEDILKCQDTHATGLESLYADKKTHVALQRILNDDWQIAVDTFGGPEKASEFMLSANTNFQGRRPLEHVVRGDSERKELISLISRIDHGVYI